MTEESNRKWVGTPLDIGSVRGVDVVLAGHRHVPFFWDLSGVRVVHSGTAASERIRGAIGPSYNLIDLGADEVEVTLRDFRTDDRKTVARFPREPAQTAEFHLERERFVLYDELPF